MKRYILIIIVAISCVFATAVVYWISWSPYNPENISIATAQDAIGGAQQKIPAPPPPPTPVPPRPFPDSAVSAQTPAEPTRTLIGVTKEQLTIVEKFLPAGAHISSFPISNDSLEAAYINADLDKDGGEELVVVFTAPSSDTQSGKQLTLAVMSRSGAGWIVPTSASLPGSYIFSNIYDWQDVPFGVRDVTGDDHLEIIVTSSNGASLGAILQVFSFNGSSLNEIAHVPGHVIHIIDKGAGKPAIITAQSRGDEVVKEFIWKGQKFEEAR